MATHASPRRRRPKFQMPSLRTMASELALSLLASFLGIAIGLVLGGILLYFTVGL